MTTRKPAHRIDFETWLDLARNDPARFETLRSRMLDDCIARSSTAHQERLRRLQWRIDRIRDRASNPLAACVQISDLMWDTFNRLGAAYRQLERPAATAPKLRPGLENTPRCAKILPFPPRP